MRGAKSPNDFDDFFQQGYDVKCFQNDLIFTKERFIGLHLSASYRLDTSDSNYSRYMGELIKVFDVYSNKGILKMPNFTRSYAGTI